MFFYIIIYFLLIPLIYFDLKPFFKLKYKKIILYSLCIFYAYIAGMGDWRGTDWDQYYDIYQDTNWSNVFSFDRTSRTTMESGYMILNAFFKTFSFKFTTFSFFLALFYYCSYVRFFLKYCKYPIFVFVIYMFMAVQLELIRQHIAQAVLLWAVPYLLERNFKKFCGVVIIASLIHESAIIFIITYPLYFLPYNLYWVAGSYMIIAVFGGPIRDFFVTFLMGNFTGNLAAKAEWYGESQVMEITKGVSTIVLNLFFLVLFNFCYQKESSEDVKRKLNIVGYSVLGMYLIQLLFAGVMSDISRMATNYIFAVYFMWNYFFESIKLGYKSYYNLFIVFTICYILYKFSSFIIFDPYYQKIYIPYRTIDV